MKTSNSRTLLKPFPVEEHPMPQPVANRPPAKKKPQVNFMGWIFSAILITVVTVVVILTSGGTPDKVTWRVGPKMLEVRNFRKLTPISTPGSGDASGAWEAIWQYHAANKDKVNAMQPTTEQAEICLDMIIAAGETGTVTGKFLDDTIPTKPKAYPNYGDAMRETAFMAMRYANVQHQKGGAAAARAERAAHAVFNIAYTMYDKSNRLPIRNEGIDMMRNIADVMLEWYPEGSAKRPLAKEWNDALDNFVIDFWEPKWSICYSVRPDSIGDIVKMARDDKDVAWRVEAILGMSWVKFAKGRGQGNDRAIREALELLTKDPNKTVAEAAKLANSFTATDVKTMR